MGTKHTTTKPSACSDQAETNLREFLEGVQEKAKSAEHDILQMGKLFCGLRAIAGVLEYASQPSSDGTGVYSTDFDNDISQLLDVMGEYGASLAYGQYESDGIFGVCEDLEQRISVVSDTKAGER